MAQPAYGYTNIISNATTLIRSGTGGILRGITVNNAGSTWVITIYDDITAVAAHKVGTITSPLQQEYLYDAALTNGLTIVTSGTTPGDITVRWA